VVDRSLLPDRKHGNSGWYQARHSDRAYHCRGRRQIVVREYGIVIRNRRRRRQQLNL